MSASEKDPRAQWGENQRALARALGLSIDEWLDALGRGAERTTGLTAAVVGAAMARGLGLSVLDGLDGQRLLALARSLIDPRPPRVVSPVLKEAIRRADDLTRHLGERQGAGRLRRKAAAERAELPTPQRETRPLGDSSDEATADAPGRAKKKRAPKTRAAPPEGTAKARKVKAPKAQEEAPKTKARSAKARSAKARSAKAPKGTNGKDGASKEETS